MGVLHLLKEHMASSTWFFTFFRLWLQSYQADTRRKILSYERQYHTSAERMAELRLQEDLHILKDAQVVGMTTTGKKIWGNLPAPTIPSLYQAPFRLSKTGEEKCL